MPRQLRLFVWLLIGFVAIDMDLAGDRPAKKRKTPEPTVVFGLQANVEGTLAYERARAYPLPSQDVLDADNTDKASSGASAVRCRVFKGLRETTARAWEADALPTELFPLSAGTEYHGATFLEYRRGYVQWHENGPLMERGERQMRNAG